MKKMDQLSAGDPIRESWLGALTQNVNALQNLAGADPIAVSMVGDAQQIRFEGSPARMWLGVVVSDADSDYSDARYWIRRQNVNNTGAVESDYISYESDVSPRNDLVTAINIAEYDPVDEDFGAAGHYVAEDTPVMVWEFKDDSVPPTSRYVFSAWPRFCVDSDWNPEYSDETYSDAKSPDITGSAANSDHWSLTGHMYVDSDGRMNPWAVLDPGTVGIHFAVKVTQDGSDTSPGSGDSDTQCSYTYLVTNIASDTVLASGASPLKPRPETGQLIKASDQSYAVGFYDDGTFKLWDVAEALATSDCG